jgi:hypothetical protein
MLGRKVSPSAGEGHMPVDLHVSRGIWTMHELNGYFSGILRRAGAGWTAVDLVVVGEGGVLRF